MWQYVYISIVALILLPMFSLNNITLFYGFQYCSRATLSTINIKKEQEWFISLIQHLRKVFPRQKDHAELVRQMFTIWEECTLDSMEQNDVVGKLF